MPRDPGLVLCALFTLRFEAPYILPWVAHHRLLGVDRLLLYHDDASGMWSPSLSERHSELLSALREHDDWITLWGAWKPRRLRRRDIDDDLVAMLPPLCLRCSHGAAAKKGEHEGCRVNTRASRPPLRQAHRCVGIQGKKKLSLYFK